MARKRADTSGGALRGGFGGYSAVGGATKFKNLTDVPHSYTGKGGDVVIVKADESGLDFTAEGLIDDHKVLADSTDTPTYPGYLDDKIEGGAGISTSVDASHASHLVKIGCNIGDTLSTNISNELIVAPQSLTDAEVYPANVDGTAVTPSMRTLGTGSQQAAPGNIIVSVSNATDEAAAFAAGSLIVIRTDLI